MTDIEIPAGVGWTALMTAYGRAQESREKNGLFHDSLASELLGVVNGKNSGSSYLPRLGPAVDDNSSTLWNAFRFAFSMRTVFFDERILRAIGDGCRQVVMLGAGLDSRAFRLGLAEQIKFFELDQAPVLDFKREVLKRSGLQPTCHRIPLAVDLLADWHVALVHEGFDLQQPTVWAAEGVLMYLSRPEADLLLDRITALSAPGSRFAGEYFSRELRDSDIGDSTMDDQDWAAWHLTCDAFRYGPLDNTPAAWMADHGWIPGEITTVADIGRKHSRAIPSVFAAVGGPQVLVFDGARTKVRANPR